MNHTIPSRQHSPYLVSASLPTHTRALHRFFSTFLLFLEDIISIREDTMHFLALHQPRQRGRPAYLLGRGPSVIGVFIPCFFILRSLFFSPSTVI